MSAYLETSFLVSLYSADANSADAAACIGEARGPFPLTPFGALELTNALELQIFRRETTRAEVGVALSKFETHIADHVFSRVPMPAAAYEMARLMSRKHTATLGVRALDILHVAAALELGAQSFYTFDRRQARLARAEGLATPVRIR